MRYERNGIEIKNFKIVKNFEPPAGRADESIFKWHNSHRPDAMPGEPSVIDLARNFSGATAHWLAAGLPVVNEAEYAARSAACEACEFWDAQARAGLGKCRHHACGCTKFKRWLATELCPAGKWP